MLKLNEVKSILREYNIRPSKRLGQNFLIDQNIKNKIIEAVELDSEDTVLEIGPGLGALTQDLCIKAKKVIAVEKDKRLYDFLLNKMDILSVRRSELELINGDILKYQFKDISSKLVVVGNLPYSISSPILNHIINNRGHVKSIYITVQAEFGERLVALPGSKDCSSLSCYAQFYGDPKILFKIPRGVFLPTPEVDSSFLNINFEKQIDESIDQEMLFKIIRSSFEKRRKTILNSLSSSGIFKSKKDALICLTRADILPARRPETISLQEFINLSRQLALQSDNSKA
ncbi:MAG: 16S rRNA (adenine(1518)-N(6)/adenine(1519)-N(6))-dimethyltransferase RsmA [Candidatus Omnitrophota bacterium]|nr:16S rRNA (adenine(1518)-N(6)/adenine(1519)-N(6))-dimethyltransferase RsmA [Candidatus Omnitrophota bacterium]